MGIFEWKNTCSKQSCTFIDQLEDDVGIPKEHLPVTMENILCWKDHAREIQFISILQGKFYNGLCNETYYGECVRHLAVRTGEHDGILLLT